MTLTRRSLLVIATLLTGLPVALLVAQERTPVAFEVASIKKAQAGAWGLTVYPGGRLVIPSGSLKTLVATAWGLASWQVTGDDLKGPYAIEAKPPEVMNPPITSLRHTWETIEDEQLRAMLQTLLIDRFRLRFHRETKVTTVYLLERGDGTLRLSPARADGGNSGSMGYAGGRWVIGGMSMAQVATFASTYYLRAPVIDRTGLTGLFDYRQAEPDAERPSDQLESFQRMVSEIGLRLRRTTEPVEMLVIDAAEEPAAN